MGIRLSVGTVKILLFPSIVLDRSRDQPSLLIYKSLTQDSLSYGSGRSPGYLLVLQGGINTHLLKVLG